MLSASLTRLFAVLALCAPTLAVAAPQCGDFLKAIGKMPTHTVFIDCKADKDAQIAVLRARYRVAGKDAAQVERYFVAQAKMSPLTFNCCGWEPRMRPSGARLGAFPSGHEFAYEVAMASGETVVNQRAQWAKIPAFEVTVTLPLESP